MRPVQTTDAHQTDQLAELVCSNSLKSDQHPSASWLLKEELRRAHSLLLRAAEASRVPGGQALTVDRIVFADFTTRAIESHPNIKLLRDEVTEIDPDRVTIIATGPLTSSALAEHLSRFTGSDRLFFYDSISPIVDANTVDRSIAFEASRYDKSLDGTGDYLNCPFNKAQYEHFVDELMGAQSVEAHIPNDTPFFEACLPIEEIARRGRDTLRFGPHETDGPDRSPHGTPPLRRRSTSPRERPRGQLQPGRLSEPSPVRRAETDHAPDSRTRKGRVSPLRPDSSQHLHQLARAAQHGHAVARSSERVLRGTDFGRGRLRRIHRDGSCRGSARIRASRRTRPARLSP